MNFLIQNWILVTLVLASGTLLFLPMLKGGWPGAAVSPEEAVQLINREKAVVIDVCDPSEYAAGHLVGAKNLPLAQLEAKLPRVVKNKALPLILVCQSGMRSRQAVAVAKKLGYEKVHSLSGGLGAWRAANLPTEKI